jgi:hypothetical protein
MKTPKIFLLIAAGFILAGCASTRSISNSGYRQPDTAPRHPVRSGHVDSAFAYRGELSEFDVLGVSRNQTAFDEDIQQALDAAKSIRLKPQSTLLLIQSGAMFPDPPMVDGLSRSFRVVPFSGVPPGQGNDAEGNFNFSKSLRLAAARAGAETIVCYWGILESVEEKFPTKTVSWVPLVGWVVPDERERMRIRLKVALLDVRTGNWSVFSPPPSDSKTPSLGPRRAVADQKLVERLKRQTYEASVEELLRLYSEEGLSENRAN